MFSEKDSSMMLQSKWSDSEGDEDWINLLNTNRLNTFLNSCMNHLLGIYYHKIGISKIYKKGAKIRIHMIWKLNLNYSEFWIHLTGIIRLPHEILFTMKICIKSLIIPSIYANGVITFVTSLSYCPTYLSMIALWNLLYEFQCLEWISVLTMPFLMLEMNFSAYNVAISSLVPKSKPYNSRRV